MRRTDKTEYSVSVLLHCGEEFQLFSDSENGMWDLHMELSSWAKWYTWGQQDMDHRRRAFHLIVESEAFKKYGTKATWHGWLKGDKYVIEEYPATERENREETGSE